MITLDISQAVFLYLLFSVVGVMALWIFFEERLQLPSFGEDKLYVWQCSICTYTYIDSINSDISKCPLCNSLNERKEGGQMKPKLTERATRENVSLPAEFDP